MPSDAPQHHGRHGRPDEPGQHAQPDQRQPDQPGGRPERPARGRGTQHVFEVVRTEALSPHMVRVHLGGAAFGPFIEAASPEKLATTDKYVKLLLAKPELGILPPYDLDALRAELDPADVPVRRTYTVRAVDHEARTIAVDFVVHGDEGLAGPWAASAKPGDVLALSGPGGLWAPAESDVFHLLLADESALPAVAAALGAMPADARGLALIEVGSAADEQPVPLAPGVEVRWVHRDAAGAAGADGADAADAADAAGEDDGADAAGKEADGATSALVEAVRLLPRPDGEIRVFAHGERSAMKALRAILQDDWGLDRPALSLSAYWAAGRSEDSFQAEKRQPVGAIFAD